MTSPCPPRASGGRVCLVRRASLPLVSAGAAASLRRAPCVGVRTGTAARDGLKQEGDKIPQILGGGTDVLDPARSRAALSSFCLQPPVQIFVPEDVIRAGTRCRRRHERRQRLPRQPAPRGARGVAPSLPCPRSPTPPPAAAAGTPFDAGDVGSASSCFPLRHLGRAVDALPEEQPWLGERRDVPAATRQP